MSVAVRAGRKPARSPGIKAVDPAPAAVQASASIGALAETAAAHVLDVQPRVRLELARWRSIAREMPDAVPRKVALESLRKRGNLEGAALLATLAAREHRPAAIRAQVAFQAAYNYLDELSDLRGEDPPMPAPPHDALLDALAPGTTLRSGDGALRLYGSDGGYLTALIDAARESLAQLPGYAEAMPYALGAAARIRDFQALNLLRADGGHCALRPWAARLLPAGSGYRWWESAAAAGSSLPVHALIAAAAESSLTSAHADALATAYFPAVGALHSLLDSVVDRAEDERAGRPSLLAPYGGREAVALGIAALARRALAGVAALPERARHRVLIAAMASYYMTDPRARTLEARAVREALREVLGLQLDIASRIFAARRALHRLAREPYV